MHDETTPAKPHEDNMLGVCAAVGEDFGIDPLWLRLGFGGALLFSLEWTLAVYGALALAVLASRLLFPNAKPVGAGVFRLEPWAPRLPALAPVSTLRDAA